MENRPLNFILLFLFIFSFNTKVWKTRSQNVLEDENVEIEKLSDKFFTKRMKTHENIFSEESEFVVTWLKHSDIEKNSKLVSEVYYYYYFSKHELEVSFL